MNHNFYAEYNNVLLRPLSQDDIESLRVWRNDKHATRFLRQIGYITPSMQKEWFQKYLKNQTEITFAIIETKALRRIVGSVSIYDITKDKTEFGRIQIGDSQAHGKGIGKLATALALAVAFEKLKVGTVYAYVHRENAAAYKTYMAVGFKVVGMRPSQVGGIEDKIEIDKKTLLKYNNFYGEIQYVGLNENNKTTK